MSLCAFLDGYTQKGFIKEELGLHPPLRFEFRPCTVDEGNAYADKVEGTSNKVSGIEAHKLIAGKVISWDLQDRHGKRVPINEKNVSQISRALHLKVLSIVMGSRASDPDPLASEEEQRENAEDSFRGEARPDSDRPGPRSASAAELGGGPPTSPGSP
jgi:hypothetical protein